LFDSSQQNIDELAFILPGRAHWHWCKTTSPAVVPLTKLQLWPLTVVATYFRAKQGKLATDVPSNDIAKRTNMSLSSV